MRPTLIKALKGALFVSASLVPFGLFAAFTAGIFWIMGKATIAMDPASAEVMADIGTFDTIGSMMFFGVTTAIVSALVHVALCAAFVAVASAPCCQEGE